MIDILIFGDVVTTAAVASSASKTGAATGNSVEGIFAIGFTTAAVTTRDKYTYAGDIITSGSVATTASYLGSACR